MGKFYEGIAVGLELWVRQLAWLNTAPDVEHTGKGKRPEPVTRLARMKAEKRDPILPPNAAPHVTDWLFEIGPAVQGAPIGWQDMAAWSKINGVELTPWEASTIRRLSKTYIHQQAEARKPTCAEPRLEVDEAGGVDHVSNQFAALMGAVGSLRQ